MLKWLKHIALIASGYALAPLIVSFDQSPLGVKLMAAFLGGTVFAALFGQALIKVGTILFTSAVGKKVALETLAKGITGLEQTNA